MNELLHSSQVMRCANRRFGGGISVDLIPAVPNIIVPNLPPPLSHQALCLCKKQSLASGSHSFVAAS